MMDDPKFMPRKGSKMRWVLAASLALNLVFVGVFAGAAFRMNRDGGPPRTAGPSIQNYGGPLARSLPREARRAFRGELRSDASGLPSKDERQALYREMLVALRAAPFDPQRVEDIFATQGDVAQKVQSFAQTKWLTLVAGMTDAERNEVATRLEEALQRPARKAKKRQSD